MSKIAAILFFSVACCVAFGLFLTVQNFKGSRGQAQAASAPEAVKVMERNAAFSGSYKRQLRRAVLQNADALMAQSAKDVRAVFRQPELVRVDLPTVIWQYRNGSCVLDVYFTSSRANVDLQTVAHYEVRSRSGSSEVVAEDISAFKESCVEALVLQNAVRFVNVNALYKAR